MLAATLSVLVLSSVLEPPALAADSPARYTESLRERGVGGAVHLELSIDESASGMLSVTTAAKQSVPMGP